MSEKNKDGSTDVHKGKSDLKDIRDLTFESLSDELKREGYPKYRSQQISRWLWKEGVHGFDEMTNLPKVMREKLKSQYCIRPLKMDLQQKSSDGTTKNRMKTWDGHLLEGVLIPTSDRSTACVSSQIGCSLSCAFCATGFLPRERNLEPGEIYDQVVLLNSLSEKNYNRPLTNIVFMGMGEPLLNYRNVLRAIDLITSEEGLHIAAKRITVSTAGISKMISQMAKDKVRFNLALSLHAAHDAKRNEIMAINETNNLKGLMAAMREFHEANRGELTFEYIFLKDFNDSLEDAEELAGLCGDFPVKVNIIEYNPVENVKFQRGEDDRLRRFIARLNQLGVIANVRRSRGKDIDAACGQLANKGK